MPVLPKVATPQPAESQPAAARPAVPKLDITRDIQSLTAFRRSSSEVLKQIKKTGRPVILTVNGKAEAVVQDAKSYQHLLDIAMRAEDLAAIRNGLDDAAHGRARPLNVVVEEMRREYGIPG